MLRAFEIRHFRVGKARAEFLGLFVHVHDQLRALDAFGKTGKILDQGRGGELSAWLAAFQNERAQVCARRRKSPPSTRRNRYRQ